jgi:hypothetical protein
MFLVTWAQIYSSRFACINISILDVKTYVMLRYTRYIIKRMCNQWNHVNNQPLFI